MTTPTTPRTPDSRGSPNRLAQEMSPYLLQHAHNPVDWRAWGPEAFAEARRRQAPIFLSIGYSTCYWCHVMERESFEDPRIGALMSREFVCVKVDREERPDVDDIYMGAVQAMTGRGGWPMSVFLTPPGARGEADRGLEPFYAGTYFPPRPRHGLPSFEQVLRAIADAWRTQRPQAIEQAGVVAERLREALAPTLSPVKIGEEQIVECAGTLLRMFDPAHGGFGGAPKFPQPVYLEFLLDALADAGDERTAASIRTVVRTTLDKMALGGMFDQAGGGFHRYSVDERWLVPHFEKMLYDNAQLLAMYARAASELGDPFHAQIGARIAAYIGAEMTSPEGLFYSAQDAEVDGREGLNYLWTPEEVRAAVGEADVPAAFALFGLAEPANFRDPHHPDEPARHILRLDDRPERIAERLGMDFDTLDAARTRIHRSLMAARARRKQPRLDDKAIASWNGMMIGALADAARAIDEPQLLDRAERAGEAVWGLMQDADGALRRVRREGRSAGEGTLEDYAWLARAFASLARAHRVQEGARATLSQRWVDRAEAMLRRMLTLFGDARDGALWDTHAGRDDLIVRTRSTFDGSTPSGASTALHAMLDVHELTFSDEWLGHALRLLATLSGAVAESPAGAANATRALLRVLRIDPALIERHGMTAPPEDKSPASPRESPVEILAEAERLTVPPEPQSGASLRVLFRMKEGFHITAHDPWPEEVDPDARLSGVRGLEIMLAPGSGEAVRLEVDYPAGHLLPAEDHEAPVPPMLVHTGEIEITIRLIRTHAPWTGRPLLLARWQACTMTECLAPTTVELDIAIDPG